MSMKKLGVLLLLSVLPACSQSTDTDPQVTPEAPSQGEGNRSVLGETPTPKSEVIKDKDLYEKTGYWHPFHRMVGFVVDDQKRIWTSPFRTSKKDAKYWAIFG